MRRRRLEMRALVGEVVEMVKRVRRGREEVVEREMVVVRAGRERILGVERLAVSGGLFACWERGAGCKGRRGCVRGRCTYDS
jgi:hypothetical protein